MSRRRLDPDRAPRGGDTPQGDRSRSTASSSLGGELSCALAHPIRATRRRARGAPTCTRAARCCALLPTSTLCRSLAVHAQLGTSPTAVPRGRAPPPTPVIPVASLTGPASQLLKR